jgi:hypothetical protein
VHAADVKEARGAGGEAHTDLLGHAG